MGRTCKASRQSIDCGHCVELRFEWNRNSWVCDVMCVLLHIYDGADAITIAAATAAAAMNTHSWPRHCVVTSTQWRRARYSHTPQAVNFQIRQTKTISRLSSRTNVLPFAHRKSERAHTHPNTKHNHVDSFGHINHNLDRILNSFFDYSALPFEKNDRKNGNLKRKNDSYCLHKTCHCSQQQKHSHEICPAWIGKKVGRISN